MQSHKSTEKTTPSSSLSPVQDDEQSVEDLRPCESSLQISPADAAEYILDMVLELKDMATACGQTRIAEGLGQFHSKYQHDINA